MISNLSIKVKDLMKNSLLTTITSKLLRTKIIEMSHNPSNHKKIIQISKISKFTKIDLMKWTKEKKSRSTQITIFKNFLRLCSNLIKTPFSFNLKFWITFWNRLRTKSSEQPLRNGFISQKILRFVWQIWQFHFASIIRPKLGSPMIELSNQLKTFLCYLISNRKDLSPKGISSHFCFRSRKQRLKMFLKCLMRYGSILSLIIEYLRLQISRVKIELAIGICS